MKVRSAALFLASTTFLLSLAPIHKDVLAQEPEPASTPEPSPSPEPTPMPAAPSMPPRPIRTQTPATIGQAFPLDYRSIAERLQEDPNNPALLNEYGNYLVQHGRLELAIKQYEKALKIQPNLPIIWNNLGVAYTASGKHADGERAYRRAIRLNPGYALAWYNLGANFDQRGVYDDAINTYQKAIELDPTLLDVRVNPQVASNRYVATILVKSYVDKGGSVVLPVQSMYPPKPRRKSN